MIKKLKHIFKNTRTKTAIGTLNMAIALMILSVALGASLASPASAVYVGSVTVGTQVGTLTNGTAGSVTYPITVTRGGSSGAFSAALGITSTLPTGASYSFSPDSLSFAIGESSKTSTLTLNTTIVTPAASTSFTVRARKGSGDSQNGYGTLTVNNPVTKLAQTITFGTLLNKTYGEADFPLSATASSGLVVTFSASGVCTVTGSSVHIIGAGSCTITANQSGNASYNAAPDVSQSFTITPASSTTTVTCPVSQTYTGSAIIPCSVTVTGAGGLSLTPAPVYGDNVDAGTASASYSYAGDTNHAVSSDSKTFTITPASSTTQ